MIRTLNATRRDIIEMKCFAFNAAVTAYSTVFDRRKVRPVRSGQSPNLELIRRKGRAREASDVFEQTRM